MCSVLGWVKVHVWQCVCSHAVPLPLHPLEGPVCEHSTGQGRKAVSASGEAVDELSRTWGLFFPLVNPRTLGSQRQCAAGLGVVCT